MAQSDTEQPEFTEVAPQPSPSQHVRPSRRRQLPWIWLAVGFVAILALGSVVYLVGGGAAEPLDVAEPTDNEAAVSEPTATAQRPAPTTTSPPASPTSSAESAGTSKDEIESGIEVEVTGTGINGLSIRSGPGTNYARLKTAPDGTALTVLEGPEEADGYEWWRIEDDEGTVGWGVGDYLRPKGE